MTVTEAVLSWSKSASGALKECVRKHAMSYGENQTDEMIRAKKLKNRHLWAGAAAHDAVAGVLKDLSQGQPKPEAMKIISDIRDKMRAEFKASKEGSQDDMRLLEHEMDQGLNKAEWAKIWDKVETSIEWFFKSTWMERLSLLGPENWKAINEVVTFDVEGVKTSLKIDAGIEKDGRFFLIDWKTGSLHPDDQKSMAVAALYAHEVWGAEPEQIEAITVSLKDGRSRKTPINEETLMNAVLTIHEESASLGEASAQFGENPMEAPMTTHLGLCQRCSFQKICHPGGVNG